MHFKYFGVLVFWDFFKGTSLCSNKAILDTEKTENLPVRCNRIRL